MFSFETIAQTDSIRNEILNAQNSTVVLIVKGRSLLKDKFIEGDFKKVAEIEDFLLNKLPNSEYITLFPEESWFIKYWTKDYNGIINSINKYDSVYHELRLKTLPSKDNMYIDLYKKSYLFKSYLLNSINEAKIAEHDKAFLIMHLNSCLYPGLSKEITQESLNKMADVFLAKYPKTIFKDYIRFKIRYSYSTPEWAWDFCLFSGYGIFTGELKNSFSNNIPIGLDFDIYYKKYTLFLRAYLGIGRTNRDFSNKGVIWEKKSQANTFIPELAFGYKVFEYKRFNFTPFVGIASTDIAPTEADTRKLPDLEKYELNFKPTFNIGINIDIYLSKNLSELNFPPLGLGFIRIRYSYYMPQFSRYYNGFGGNMHSITIGFGGVNRSVKRQY